MHGLKQAAEDTILAMMGGVGVSAVGTSIVEGTLQFDSRSMRSQLAQTPAASRGHRALSPAVAMCSKGPILCWHSRRKGHRPFEEACVGGGIDRGQGQAPLEDCVGSGARNDGGHGRHPLEEVCICRGARKDCGHRKQSPEDACVGRGAGTDHGPFEDICVGSGAHDDYGQGKHHLEEACTGRGARIDCGQGKRSLEDACVGRGAGTDHGQGKFPLEDTCVGSGAHDDCGHGKHHLEEACIGRGARIDRGQGKQPLEDVWVGRGDRKGLEHGKQPLEEACVGSGARKDHGQGKQPPEDDCVGRGTCLSKLPFIRPWQFGDGRRVCSELENGQQPISRDQRKVDIGTTVEERPSVAKRVKKTLREKRRLCPQCRGNQADVHEMLRYPIECWQCDFASVKGILCLECRFFRCSKCDQG